MPLYKWRFTWNHIFSSVRNATPPEIWNINTDLCDVSGQTKYSGGWLLFSGQTKYSGGWLLFSGQAKYSGGWLLFSGQANYSGGWLLFSGQTNYSGGWLLFSGQINYSGGWSLFSTSLIMFLSLYIYSIHCLSVFVFCCLFVSNKRQNGWTDLAQILVFVSTFSIFVRFWKSTLKNCKSVIEKLK